jgi:hypothetical protein
MFISYILHFVQVVDAGKARKIKTAGIIKVTEDANVLLA